MKTYEEIKKMDHHELAVDHEKALAELEELEANFQYSLSVIRELRLKLRLRQAS